MNSYLTATSEEANLSGTNIWEPLNEYKATYWGLMEDKDSPCPSLGPISSHLEIL